MKKTNTIISLIMFAYFSVYVVMQDAKNDHEVLTLQTELEAQVDATKKLESEYNELEKANETTKGKLVESQNLANGYKFQLDALNKSNGWSEDE